MAQYWEPSVCAAGELPCRVLMDGATETIISVERACSRHRTLPNAAALLARCLEHERRVNFSVRSELLTQVTKLAAAGALDWSINPTTDDLEITLNVVLTTAERNRVVTALAAHPEWRAVLL